MEEPGQKLKRARERLNLRYRDVEEASARIADRRGSDEFAIALSRLADIENRGTVPSIYRLYALCAIYRLDIREVLGWYGIDLSNLPADATEATIDRTHAIGFTTDGFGDVTVPLSLDPGLDLRKTTFLSRIVQRWGKLPLVLLNGLDLHNYRYAFIGTEDWSMYPLLAPGSFVVVDDSKRKIAAPSWTNEYDRPIYFLEHRGGWVCGWCSQVDDKLVVQSHPSSRADPVIYRYPSEIEVVGQVVGVAMRLDQAKRRQPRP